MRTICQTATILMTFSTLSVCILWGALPEGVVIFSRGNAIFPSSLQAQKCCTLFECVVTTVNNYHSATFSAPLHTPAASASPVHDWIRSAVRSGNGCVPQSLPQSLSKGYSPSQLPVVSCRNMNFSFVTDTSRRCSWELLEARRRVAGRHWDPPLFKCLCCLYLCDAQCAYSGLVPWACAHKER